MPAKTLRILFQRRMRSGPITLNNSSQFHNDNIIPRDSTTTLHGWTWEQPLAMSDTELQPCGNGPN